MPWFRPCPCSHFLMWPLLSCSCLSSVSVAHHVPCGCRITKQLSLLWNSWLTVLFVTFLLLILFFPSHFPLPAEWGHGILSLLQSGLMKNCFFQILPLSLHYQTAHHSSGGWKCSSQIPICCRVPFFQASSLMCSPPPSPSPLRCLLLELLFTPLLLEYCHVCLASFIRCLVA